MFRMVARLGVPYVLMSQAADMKTMLVELARDVQQLRDYGQKDIIVDPGFGFGKTLDDNYAVMRDLSQLQLLELPVLVGVSRKSMIHRLLDLKPEEALNGTTVLNTMALERGAKILRVHDVREAVECVQIWRKIK
jgi:dihydropteroate synthase